MEQKGGQPVTYHKGDKVWLETTHLRTKIEKRKFRPKRIGSFEVSEVLEPLSYRLKLPLQWRIHDIFHAVLLTPYVETEAHGPNFSQPPPELINEEEEYKVEAILAHCGRGKFHRYLIK